MSKLIALGRIALGAWLLALGANDWLQVVPVTGGSTALSSEFVHAFSATGLLAIAAGVLAVSGVLMLVNRLTVLALTAAIPISVLIAYWAIGLERTSPMSMMAAGMVLLNGLLLLAYWPHCRQLMQARATLADTQAASKTQGRVISIARYVWGTWYVISGCYYFFLQPYYGSEPLAVLLIAAIMDTKLYFVVKGTEFVGGVLMLAQRWVPLGLLINVPVSFVVIYWDAYLQGKFGPFGLFIAGLTLTFSGILLWAYREYYRPLFAWRPRHVAEASLIAPLLTHDNAAA